MQIFQQPAPQTQQRNTTQNVNPSANFHPASEFVTCTNQQDQEEKSKKIVAKRDTWTNQQKGALVNAWKKHFCELESFRQPSGWLKVKAFVDKNGLKKSVKQIKVKLLRLKDAYKLAKENNSKTGASPQFCQYYKDFEEMLGERDAISFKNVKEVGCAKSISPTNSVEGN